METTFALDYISATTKDHSLNQVMKRLAFGLNADEWITVKALHGYQHAIKHPFGHVISWTNKRDDMGINVLFTGLPLKELHDRGENTCDIMRWMAHEGFKFARIDLAIDVFGVSLDLDDLQRADYKGSVNSLPKLIKDGPNNEEGATLYIGSWKSDKFIRIYDKAGEQGMKDLLWYRFEIESKGVVAVRVCAKIMHMTDAEIAKFTQGMILAMWNPEREVIRKIMDAQPEKVSSTKDVNHRAYDWLMSSVSVTLARVILELPHRDVMRTFQAEVDKHIREIAAKAIRQQYEDKHRDIDTEENE